MYIYICINLSIAKFYTFSFLFSLILSISCYAEFHFLFSIRIIILSSIFQSSYRFF